MNVKITKQPDVEDLYVGKCPICHCEFEALPCDLKVRKVPMGGWDQVHYEAKCPGCNVDMVSVRHRSEVEESRRRGEESTRLYEEQLARLPSAAAAKPPWWVRIFPKLKG